MLRRRRIADDGAPTLSTIVRTVHAALIGGPHLTRFDAGAEQRCDCAGWLWPTVADPLPALANWRLAFTASQYTLWTDGRRFAELRIAERRDLTLDDLVGSGVKGHRSS